MEHRDEGDLDRKLREALEPEAEAVRRVIGRALASKSRRRSLLVPALAAIGICAAVWLISVRPSGEAPEVFTLECVGELAVIRAPDGTSWILSMDGREPGPSVQTGLIICEGDLP